LGDNEAANGLANNVSYSAGSKHIDIRYHFIRNNIKRGDIKVIYVPSKSNLTDLLTKPLPPVDFTRLRLLLGLRDVNL